MWIPISLSNEGRERHTAMKYSLFTTCMTVWPGLSFPYRRWWCCIPWSEQLLLIIITNDQRYKNNAPAVNKNNNIVFLLKNCATKMEQIQDAILYTPRHEHESPLPSTTDNISDLCKYDTVCFPFKQYAHSYLHSIKWNEGELKWWQLMFYLYR